VQVKILDDIAATCRAARPHIVLSEGVDARVVAGAARAAAEDLAEISVVADPSVFASLAKGLEGAERITVHDPTTSDHLEHYARVYHQLREHKGVDEAAARNTIQSVLGFAAMMVREGHADGTIGGAMHTTADTVRAALQIIGKAPEADIVSSFFLMILPPPHDRPVIFSDCGLILEPSAAGLVSIAVASATSLATMTGLEPRVAMLSFSTKGSVPAKAHPSLGRIHAALDLIHAQAPDLIVDGEIQFDAAIMPKVAASKAPESPVAGEANVFVFPDLNAGNIGYKIAQRIGGAMALGPVLQGLAAPANDLSRGCSAEDVYQMIAITGAQVAARKAKA
jgi:phosphate acetyltransferase